MKPLRQAIVDGITPGVVATVTTCLMVASRGAKDSGSALAPINASSHVLWGESSAGVERATVRHTLPGVLVNLGGALWWSVVYQKLFGAVAERRGPGGALLGSLATSVLAYVVDYKLVPRRFTPGWEYRISHRSLYLSLAAMAGGIAAGVLFRKR